MNDVSITDMSERKRLFREAADLAIRLQNDPTNQVALDMVRGWVARGPSYQEAWRRVAAIHGMTGKVMAAEDPASTRHVLSRRNFLAGGALGIGAVAIGAATLPDILLRLRADHVTATAEIRRIDLTDGSRLTLGPDSAVALAFTTEARAIQLLEGMAYLDVAANPAVPLLMSSGPLSVRTGEGAFDLSRDADIATISVERGTLEAWQAPNDATTASAGEWLRFLPGAAEPQRGDADASRVAAWRTGMLVADGETVAALVAKLSRWHPGQVIIADLELGSRKVSGVFDLSDPDRALDAVVRPFGGKVRNLGGLLTVISTV